MTTILYIITWLLCVAIITKGLSINTSNPYIRSMIAMIIITTIVYCAVSMSHKLGVIEDPELLENFWQVYDILVKLAHLSVLITLQSIILEFRKLRNAQ